MEQKIVEWAEKMVKEFSWLTIKVERSEEFATCLVDLVYPVEHADDDVFNRETLEFEEMMTRLYGDNVPLFTDNGELFSVSDNAQVVTCGETTFTEVEVSGAIKMSQLLSNYWLDMDSVSYDQKESNEMQITTAKNNSDDYYLMVA
jgi:hypothetical protein